MSPKPYDVERDGVWWRFSSKAVAEDFIWAALNGIYLSASAPRIIPFGPRQVPPAPVHPQSVFQLDEAAARKRRGAPQVKPYCMFRGGTWWRFPSRAIADEFLDAAEAGNYRHDLAPRQVVRPRYIDPTIPM